jgi:hypothetical protein
MSSLYLWISDSVCSFSLDLHEDSSTYLSLVGVEYANYYAIQTTLKGAVYSIKLKLEFAIFGKLIQVVKSNSWEPDLSPRSNRLHGFVDPTKTMADVTHAPRCVLGPPNPPWVHADELDSVPLEPSAKRGRWSSA